MWSGDLHREILAVFVEAAALANDRVRESMEVRRQTAIEAKCAANADYYARNKSAIRRKVSNWQQRHRAHRAAYMRAYAERNAARLRAYYREYNSTRRKAS